MSAVFSRSRAAWYTLVLVTAGTGGGIYAIHRSQQTEREEVQRNRKPHNGHNAYAKDSDELVLGRVIKYDRSLYLASLRR
ncbi:hypothetical protein ABBQ38_005132 [Trebouxia sp. C0009 RCD-2024]